MTLYHASVAAFVLSIAHMALVRAQEPIHGEAATFPSPGALVVRQQFQFASLDRDPTVLDREIDEVSSLTSFRLGVLDNLALQLDVPYVYREVTYGPTTADTPPDHHHGGGGTTTLDSVTIYDDGFDDMSLSAKLRVWSRDFGPIDTVRVALIAGVELPTGPDYFSSESGDPYIGAVVTYVRDRHGFNVDAIWKFNDGNHPYPERGGMGEDDALFYDASYLFRLAPAAYGEKSSHEAIYLVAELNGLYETNGDHEILLAPGVMFETKRLALEFSVQLPVLQELENRPETEFTVTLGLRLFL